MNVIGSTLMIVVSTDPGKVGKSGLVVLESAKTLTLKSGDRKLKVEKAGSVFEIVSNGGVIAGSQIAGRLEDRWGNAR